MWFLYAPMLKSIRNIFGSFTCKSVKEIEGKSKDLKLDGNQ